MRKKLAFTLLFTVLFATSCSRPAPPAEKEAPVTQAQPRSPVPLNRVTDMVEFAQRLKAIQNPLVRNTVKIFGQTGNASPPFFGVNKAKAAPSDQASIEAFPFRPALWESSQIEVCWENPSTPFNAKMLDVQQAIAQTWQAASQLRFTGWSVCPPTSPTGQQSLRIQIDDSGPHTTGLGKELLGKPDGMVVNFTFNNRSPGCLTMPAYCIKGIAVHEFGHAIGFAHEQNRPDKPGDCMQPVQGSNGDDLLLTPYDPQSVMNYCNMKYNNDGNLSALDKAAVAELYGQP